MPGPGYTSPKSKRGKALGLKKPKFTYRSNTSKPAAPPKARPKPKPKAKKPKGRPLGTGMRSVRQELNAPRYRRLRERSQRRDLRRTAEQALRVASAKPLPKRYKYVAAPKPKPLRVSPRRVGTDVPKRFASKPTAAERRDARRTRRQDERDFGKVLLAAYGKGSTKEGAKARQRLVDRGTLSGETSAAQAERFKRIMNARPKRDYPGDRVLKKGLAAAGRALDDALPNPARSTVNLGKGQTARSVARAGGRVKTSGIPETKIPRSGAAAALVAAEQLTRISSAGGKGATEAIKAIQRGKPATEVGAAYVKGQVEGFVENKSSYGDALRQVGASKGASAGIGFVLDVVLDPTTYLGLGIPAAGRAAARAAGEAAGRAAVKRGASQAETERIIKAAMRGEAAVVSPGATRPRGNIAGRMRERARALESEPESPAITRQRRQLRDLEQRGQGQSRKAQNIRKNLDRAGKRKASRVERAEGTAARVERRADDAASVVTPSGRVKAKAPRSTRLFPSKGSQRARVRNMLRPARTEAKTKFSRMAERQVEGSAKGQRTDKVLSVRFAGRRVADVPLQPFSKGAVKNSGKVGSTAREVVGDVAPGIRPDSGLAEKGFAGARQAGRDERSGRGTAEVNAVLNMKAVRAATGRIDDADRDLWVAVWERSGDPATRVRVRDGRFVFGADDVLQDLPDDFARRYLVKTRRRGYQLRGTKRVNDVLKGARRKVERSGQPVGDALKIGVVRESDVQAAEESLRVARASRTKAKKEEAAISPDDSQKAAKKAIKKRTVGKQAYDPTPEGINSRKFYHGTSKEIRRREVDASMGNSDSLFGPGFYLTDNPDVAVGYARARAGGKRPKRPVLHEVELNVRNPVDLEAKAQKKFVSIVQDFARQLDETYDDSMWTPLLGSVESAIKEAIGAKGATNGKVLERLVQELTGVERSVASELMQDLQFRLMDEGFDALVHRGGGRVGKTRHQVVILLGPKGTSARLGRNAAGKLPATQPNAIRSMRPVGKRYTGKSANQAKAAASASAKTTTAAAKTDAAAKVKATEASVKDAEKRLKTLKSSRVFADDEEMASRYYPRRAAQDQDLPYQDKVDYIPPSREAQTVGAAAREQAGAATLGGSVRGNLMGRQDPRPQDVANLERFMGEGSGPIMGANPAQDFAQYGLNMERIAAYNAGVRRLAESGQSVRMKPAGEETLEEFYKRNGIMNGEPESAGMKVYELGVRGEGAGRYDLREIEPEVLQQLITGKAPGGEPTKLKRVGQYVILDERAVARFRQFRSAEVLGSKPLTRLWDRLGGRLRQLAIFTPMYQAINEMGDTWIMFTVVPGYKIPVYKTKALPVVRYLQAAEAGNRRLMRELGEAEILVGGKFMKVKDVARLTRAEGVARQGVFAKTVDITNPEVRQVTKRRKPGRIRDAAADKLASSDPYVQFLATAPKRGAQSTGRFFRSREDWSRVATWLYFMDEGYTSDRAVADSLEALIDYGELSRAERNVLRRFAFFYTFPARQIPYQTKALFRRPGKLAAYEKLRVAAADYQNIDLSDLYEQPWYVQANVPIPLRVGGEVRWVSANLPFNMLNQTLPIGSNWPIFGSGGLAERDLDFILASFNPLLRVPAEDITNRNFFFRSQIESENGMSANETPAPWYIVQLAKASPALQRKLGVYYKETRTSQGRKIWLMDKKWAWRLSQLSYGPVRVPAEAGKFRNERGQSFMDQMFRFTTGIRVDRDKSIERRTSEIFDRQSEIREQLSKMRGDPRFEGKARWMKLQAEQKQLEAELKKLGTEVGLSWGWGEQRPKGKSGGSLLDRLGPGRGNPNYTGPGAGSGESLLERLK